MKTIVSCGALALLCLAAPARAAHVDPFVITVDAHSYVSYAWPIVISPRERLVQAPEARMANCRRDSGQALVAAPNRLVYAMGGSHLEAQAMRIDFRPTRVVLQTEGGDVRCDGIALTGETGIDRVFRDFFGQD